MLTQGASDVAVVSCFPLGFQPVSDEMLGACFERELVG